MITVSHCKINIGLNVIQKRADGYHELVTIMYPIVQKGDIVECLRGDVTSFTGSGIVVDCDIEKNLCVKALRLLQQRYGIVQARLFLHKQIPFGAGLGGGSANGVAALKILSTEFELDLDDEVLLGLAAELGSDTPFFVHEIPVVAKGRGEILTPIEVDLSHYYIVIVKPPVGVSTATAYSGVAPKEPPFDLQKAVREPIERWEKIICNDFEESVFDKLPELAKIKQKLYDIGAVYASMSGSGSAIYGIFEEMPKADIEYLWHVEMPKSADEYR